MRQVFQISDSYQVLDGTRVAPFLNSRDSMSGLPFDLLEGVSVAAGTIQAGTTSKIHVMPHVTQITFVRSGELEVWMKGPSDVVLYTLRVASGAAILTEAGAFLQLINRNRDLACEVLYIVTPAYLIEQADGEVWYDDSLVLDESWDELKAAGWRTSKMLPTAAERQAAEMRMVKYAHET